MISGVYMLKNTINDKFYIGSSVNINKRKTLHFSELRRGKNKNIYLQEIYNKYGSEIFSFELIEPCNINDLMVREQYYIDTLNPDYNIYRFAYSSKGSIHSEETKRKIGKVHRGKIVSEETRRKLSTALIGYKHSEETKRKMSIGKTGIKRSKNFIKKMSIPVFQYDKDNNFIAKYQSMVEVTRILNIPTSNVVEVCKGRRNTAGGFIWKYNKN